MRWMSVVLLVVVPVLPPLACAEDNGATVDRESIETGEVYLYGNDVSGPYEFVQTDSAVLLNGVQVFPKLPAVKPPGTKVTSVAIARHALNDSADVIADRLRQNHASLSEITSALVDFYRSSPLVVEVSEVADGCFRVRWEGASAAEEHLVSLTAPKRIDLRDQLTKELGRLRDLLQRNALIIVSSSTNLYCPPLPTARVEAIRAEIRLARISSPADLEEGVWKGKFFSAAVAQQFHDPLELHPHGGAR